MDLHQSQKEILITKKLRESVLHVKGICIESMLTERGWVGFLST